MNKEPATIELDLRQLLRTVSDEASSSHPLVILLQQRGHRSISIGLHTAQVDGRLYDLDTNAELAISEWLSGHKPSVTAIKLTRHHVFAA
jgi:hypothetical protein